MPSGGEHCFQEVTLLSLTPRKCHSILTARGPSSQPNERLVPRHEAITMQNTLSSWHATFTGVSRSNMQ